mmetsp:Transcript_46136/g.114744  ORF Transcript_46136/g.114744 Transcript_46136/m.114744 type:complete len:827 (-) Transcript_46136:1603-4083(-)
MDGEPYETPMSASRSQQQAAPSKSVLKPSTPTHGLVRADSNSSLRGGQPRVRLMSPETSKRELRKGVNSDADMVRLMLDGERAAKKKADRSPPTGADRVIVPLSEINLADVEGKVLSERGGGGSGGTKQMMSSEDGSPHSPGSRQGASEKVQRFLQQLRHSGSMEDGQGNMMVPRGTATRKKLSDLAAREFDAATGKATGGESLVDDLDDDIQSRSAARAGMGSETHSPNVSLPLVPPFIPVHEPVTARTDYTADVSESPPPINNTSMVRTPYQDGSRDRLARGSGQVTIRVNPPDAADHGKEPDLSATQQHNGDETNQTKLPEMFLDIFNNDSSPSKPGNAHEQRGSAPNGTMEPRKPKRGDSQAKGEGVESTSARKGRRGSSSSDLSPMSTGGKKAKGSGNLTLHQRWLRCKRKYKCLQEPPNICKWVTTTLFGRLSKLMLIFWGAILAYSIFTYTFMAYMMERVDNLTDEVVQAAVGEYRFRHGQIATIHLVEPTLWPWRETLSDASPTFPEYFGRQLGLGAEELMNLLYQKSSANAKPVDRRFEDRKKLLYYPGCLLRPPEGTCENKTNPYPFSEKMLNGFYPSLVAWFEEAERFFTNWVFGIGTPPAYYMVPFYNDVSPYWRRQLSDDPGDVPATATDAHKRMEAALKRMNRLMDELRSSRNRSSTEGSSPDEDEPFGRELQANGTNGTTPAPPPPPPVGPERLVRPWLPPDYWWLYNALRYDLGNAFETMEELFIEEADSDLKDHETKLWILGAVDWAVLILAVMFLHYLLFEWFKKDVVDTVAILRVLPEDDIQQQKLFELFNIDLENEEGSKTSDATV